MVYTDSLASEEKGKYLEYLIDLLDWSDFSQYQQTFEFSSLQS